MRKVIKYGDASQNDIIEFEQKNGLILRVVVESVKSNGLMVRFTSFNDESYNNLLGTSVTFYYDERITFDDSYVQRITLIPRKRVLHETDYIEIMQFAVDTNDKEWFDRLGKRLTIHKKMKRGKQYENNSI